MRQLFKSVFLIFQIVISTLLISCENPFFIDATGLYKVDFTTNGESSVDSYRTNEIKDCPVTSRTDFTFAGWHKKSDFSDSVLTFPLEIKEDTTLYARWYQKFTVTFETNGGDAIESYKTGIIETAPNSSRTNYIFAGWYVQSDFSGEPVNFPYTLTKPTTFYAKWLPTYQVLFEANGGSEVASFRTTKIEASPETMLGGYTFAGWFKDLGLTQKVDFPMVLTADTILYAKWLQIFSVTFVTDGGTTISPQQTGYIETEPATSKTDASLEGWYTTENFTPETKVNFPYTVTGDITLYAKWQPVQCTITYYPNGASGGEVPSSVTVNKGSNYTVLGNTGNLEKLGYAFTKWNTKADGNGHGYSAGSSITVTGDLALYAQWGKDYAAMISVPGGSFYLGDPNSSSERPKITLSSFQIAQYELTYELWLEVYTWAKDNGYNLSSANKGYASNDQYKNFVPATNINWKMACVWLNAYSEYKGFTPVYYRGNKVWRDDTNISGDFVWKKAQNGYRLPTDCEWEFAASGGSSDEHDKYKYAGSNNLDDVAWYYDNTTGNTNVKEFSSVGTKKANKLSIYDMTGNVAELCYDRFSDWGIGELTNPVHNTDFASANVVRGGSVYTHTSMEIYKRGSQRKYNTSSYLGISDYWLENELGVRIARNAE